MIVDIWCAISRFFFLVVLNFYIRIQGGGFLIQTLSILLFKRLPLFGLDFFFFFVPKYPYTPLSLSRDKIKW